MSARRKVVVIGAGIAGLTAAFRLQRSSHDVDVTLFEQSARTGGLLHSTAAPVGNFELGADMFSIDPPAAIDLCRELDLEDQLVTARPVDNRAYIAAETGIEPVPAGFSLMLPGNIDAVLQSPLLTEAGKTRFLQEREIPRKTDSQDESLEAFATRRFGREVFERLIQPLAAGIYTADPNSLSMQATMDRFLKLEQEHGSLIAAAEHQTAPSTTSGARYGLFRSIDGGIQRITDRLIEKLGPETVQLNRRVTQLQRTQAGWSIEWTGTGSSADSRSGRELADGVVIAIGAQPAARVLSSACHPLAMGLATIPAASAAIVVLQISRSQLQRDFEGYGIVIPDYLQRDAIALSFSNNKFQHGIPANRLVIRCFFGGAMRPELVQEDAESLTGKAVAEVDQWLGLTGDPDHAQIVKWIGRMPQYTMGHAQRVARIERLVADLPGLELAGNSYHGVGIPFCVASGNQAAERLRF